MMIQYTRICLSGSMVKMKVKMMKKGEPRSCGVALVFHGPIGPPQTPRGYELVRSGSMSSGKRSLC